MARFLGLLPFLLLTLPGLAEGKAFIFPNDLAGFTRHPGGADFAAGGPIDTLLEDNEDIRCNTQAVHEYQDGPAAIAGLSAWLAQQELKPRDYARTQ